MAGQLFTRYFLADGVKATAEWRASVDAPGAFADFHNDISAVYQSFRRHNNPNEATTEQDLIRPVLELLGWADYLPQQGASGNEDIPDHLLYPNAGARQRAAGEDRPEQRFRHALALEESKRFGLHLDQRGDDGRNAAGTPHGQILRYLATANNVTDGRMRWGLLTNGGVWRLYDYRARPRSGGYYEASLDTALAQDDADALRRFHLLFRRDSFTPQEGAALSFLERALSEGRRYEEQLAKDLSGVVFNEVFPALIEALAAGSPGDLPSVREAALVFLYRLLFALYAEDRGLLPVNDARYDDYGLRKRVRDDIAQRISVGDAFSAVAANYYGHLSALFRLIDRGDDAIGLPPSNGGLFTPEAAPLLESVQIPDAVLAPIIYGLSHTETGGQQLFVNYRDLSVQQLGSIYEHLLEREPFNDAAGRLGLRLNPYARKDSGSFFTPQELVDLVVEHTLGPLVEERRQAFTDKARELHASGLPLPEQAAELARLDPAEAALDLKVLDPAMGSGHFLVTAVDFLADKIIEFVETAPAMAGNPAMPYESPLAGRVAALRRAIIRRASVSDWALNEELLTDQAIIRRMALKRCIYGVDKNPLTVELAKVSLWLHSFTAGAPLSFLDHHLRCGDALLGLWVRDAVDDLRQLGSLFTLGAVAEAEAAAAAMQRIEEMSDADIAEVRASADLFRQVEDTTAGLRGLHDTLGGLRWLRAGRPRREHSDFNAPLTEVLGRQLENAYHLLSGGPGPEMNEEDEPSSRQFVETWNDARAVAQREGFLHWEAAFPGVWQGWQNDAPQGGFDAVIGNPPWDRIKLQEVEWFAARAPQVARAPTAAQRKAGIAELSQQQPALFKEFAAAQEQANGFNAAVRASGHYPLMGHGDINLYSLFVERAESLVKPRGLVGLLTPSGIYGDLTAAKFFRQISTGGRAAGVFDFENGKIFFKDIHASFKLCAFIFGGPQRQFAETQCAFFLRDPQGLKDPERCFSLTADDFARVNPNTGTAPVFRTRRDAEITRRIYQRCPVLVNRARTPHQAAWPLTYHRMFDMTNDSYHFRTAERLQAEGFYPVAGHRWRKGGESYAPLYEGKMVQAYDHRAASVVVNPENLHRPGQPREAAAAEHADPEWFPAPQFYVPESAIAWPEGLGWAVAFKHVTAPTNARTMIACLAPQAGFGNSLPLFLPEELSAEGLERYREIAPLFVANLNSMAFDFVTRQKVQGQNLNLFVVEQLPFIAEDDYARLFGGRTAGELVRDHVLRLTYTARDMEAFARDLGYAGEPWAWDDEERRHRRARLDALYFHLYHLSREDAAYIMDTFPIVRRQDESRYQRYRTRELVLAYMSALAAGDGDSVVAA